MSEKPILFNTEMVRAILDGRKTQTRRVIRFPEGTTGHLPPSGAKDYIYWPGGIKRALYKPGDTLWVRETWTEDGRNFYYRADFENDWLDPCETLSGGYPIYCSYHPGCEGCMREKQRIHWHPSIHMPKRAARIFLRVTDICCERLQDITEQDARAEGFVTDQPEDGRTNINFMCSVDCLQGSARGKFALLWNSTIKKSDLRTYGWDANPWVWVISFKKIERDQLLRYADNDVAQGGLAPAT